MALRQKDGGRMASRLRGKGVRGRNYRKNSNASRANESGDARDRYESGGRDKSLDSRDIEMSKEHRDYRDDENTDAKDNSFDSSADKLLKDLREKDATEHVS